MVERTGPIAVDVLERWRTTNLGGLPVLLGIGLSLGLAACFLLGDPARFNGASWVSPFRLLPQHGWGALYAGYALLLAAACTRSLTAVRYAMSAGAFPNGFLAVAFAWSALQIPTAALTGIVAYIAIAVAHPIMAEMYRR